MKVLAIDDHFIVREGLRRLLEQHYSLTRFGEAADATEARTLFREDKWDLVILDLTINGVSGLEILKEIRSLNLSVPVLVLSMHTEEQYALRAFKAGASGYVTKGSPSSQFLQAVKTVLEGRRYASGTMTQLLLATFERGQEHAAPHETLSDREFEVMRLIAQGKTVGQIAELLSLSEKTISTYRSRILTKMGMNTNAELMSYAFQAHLVE